MKTLRLNNGLTIPILGFGTWQLRGDICFNAVKKALEIGYRHIDTADAYDNHKEVGKAIKSVGISRKELFITSKVWTTDLHTKVVIDAGRRFLDELQTDYIDLLLIHWPNKSIPIEETLTGMDQLKKEGVIKAYGVSNFTIHHLEDALKTGMAISNNQVELHPSLNQKLLRNFCKQNNIAVTAYSPIAQGEDLSIETIATLAKKYSRSPSQVILCWLIHHNIITIPRSSNPEHIADNFKALEWELHHEDIKLIDQLDRNNRTVNPNFSEFDY